MIICCEDCERVMSEDDYDVDALYWTGRKEYVCEACNEARACPDDGREWPQAENE